MALNYQYLSYGGFKLAGSADNLASIQHYYKFENRNLDSFGVFDLVGTNQYQAGIVGNSVLTSKFSTIQGNAEVDGAFFSGNDFTFCMWFKVGTLTKNQNVFELESPYENIVIKFDSSTKNVYFNSLSNVISSAVISSLNWYFVCVRKTGSNVSVQLNDEDPVTYAYAHSPAKFNSVIPTNLDVISPTKDSALFWDDVRFYSRYLRTEEVDYVYNNGTPQAILGGDQSNLYNIPTHYYPFDNGVADNVGSSNLVLSYYSTTGGTSPIIEGKFNNALQVGDTYDLNSYLGYTYYGYTSYSGNIIGNTGGSYSISFWVKRFAEPLPNITEQISILSILSATDVNILQFGYNGRNLFKVDDGTINGSEIELSTVLIDWNHFGIVYNNDQGRYTFYLNGNIFGEIKSTRSPIDASKFYLGWDGLTYKSGSPYLCQDVLIDDLRIYSFPITGWDFLALYNTGSFNSIEKSLAINFNLGTMPLKAYQIDSYEFYEDDPLSQVAIPNPQHTLRTIVQQVWARDVNEVCRKIKALNFFMSIKSISEWSNNLIGPNGGGSASRDQYGSYVEIANFCENAECVDFCLGVNAVVNISAISYASSNNNSILGSGFFQISGSASVACQNNQYFSSGSFQITGNANASQIGGIDNTSFVGTGGFGLTGSSSQNSSDQGVLLVEAGGDMNVLQITSLLPTIAGNTLVGFGTVSREDICDCLNVPYQVNLRHNLTKSSELTRFVSRNSLSLPSIITMTYNEKIRQYSGNIRLEGISSFINEKEYWNIVFNLYCTGEYNSFAQRYNWILNINLKRSTVGFADKETNVVVYLLSSYICPQFDASKFKFKVNVNLNTLITQVNNSSFVNSTNVNDRISLFLSDAWLSDPNLVISVGV